MYTIKMCNTEVRIGRVSFWLQYEWMWSKSGLRMGRLMSSRKYYLERIYSYDHYLAHFISVVISTILGSLRVHDGIAFIVNVSIFLFQVHSNLIDQHKTCCSRWLKIMWFIFMKKKLVHKKISFSFFVFLQTNSYKQKARHIIIIDVNLILIFV